MPNHKLLSSAADFPPPPPLNRKQVFLPELQQGDDIPYVFEYELTALEYARFVDGVRDDRHANDLQYLTFTTRDQHGNRLWPDVARGVKQLGQYGQSVIARLLLGANEVNTVDLDSDPVEEAEKDSETTPSVSNS